MNNLNWLCAITILFAILITGCSKSENESKDKKMVPVKYYLSEDDKSLLDYFYDNKIITFSDQYDNELVFTTDSLYDITEKAENNLRNGEELIMRYSCTTEYFPNYSFVIILVALDTSRVRLEIMFGTGTFWNDRGNDYVLSKFALDPKSYPGIDTICPNFHDTLTLGSRQFERVYHMWRYSYNQDIHETKDCYYTNELGVVAFKNLDNKFWIRKTE